MSIVPAGLALMLVLGTPPVVPSSPDIARFGAVIVVGGLAYYALVGATRIGEVSAVVPFRYTRLVFAMILGNLIFGERPDALMLSGAALVVVTGVYTIWRGAGEAKAGEP
jgi:drug/metabolite transporter (DMT)-like permease